MSFLELLIVLMPILTGSFGELYDPSCESKTKIDPVRGMLHSAVYSQDL